MSNPMQRESRLQPARIPPSRRRGRGGEGGEATVSPGAVRSPTSTSSHQRHHHQQGNTIAGARPRRRRRTKANEGSRNRSIWFAMIHFGTRYTFWKHVGQYTQIQRRCCCCLQAPRHTRPQTPRNRRRNTHTHTQNLCSRPGFAFTHNMNRIMRPYILSWGVRRFVERAGMI